MDKDMFFVARQNQNVLSLRNISRWISIFFHPFFIPTYAVLILLFSSSALSVLELNLKLYFLLLMLLTTCILPLLSIFSMWSLGVVKDFNLSARKERILPILVMVLCYILCSAMMPVTIISFLIDKFIVSTILCASVVFVINMYWKISLHLIAMGAMTTLLVYSSIYGYGTDSVALLMIILMSGILASTRLYLGLHNLGQVLIGYGVGVMCGVIVMEFI